MSEQTFAAPRRRIDPRFRQRRIEVKREEGRRRLRALVAITSLLVAAGLGFGALQSPLLIVRHVRIAGASKTPADQIAAAAGVTGHRLMIDVNGSEAARAIDRLPWIATARVGRHWPATVAIVVTERTPVGVVGSLLIDKSGRVLGSAAADALPPLFADGTPPLPGPPGTTVDPAYGPALEVAAALPAALAPRVTGIVAAADGSVSLHLGRASAQLGSPADLLVQKLASVQTMLDKVNVSTAIIDVTVPSAPVLLGG